MQKLPGTGLVIVVVTFGLLFVVTASLVWGGKSSVGGLADLFRKNRRQTVLALLANFVVLPALVFLSLKALNFSAQINAGFALLSMVAGAPFVTIMSKLAKTHPQNQEYVSHLAFLEILVTIPYVTIFLPLDLRGLDTGIHVHDWQILWPLLVFILLPLAIGMFLNARYPELAEEMTKWLAPISLIAIVLHVSLYMAAFWTTLENEFGTGGFLYSIGFAIAGWLAGYYLCHPALSKSSERGPRVDVAIATAQKGSQAAIATLVFAFGVYYVTGVAVLASSIITIVLVILASAELGRSVKGHATPRIASPAPPQGSVSVERPTA